MEKYVDNYFYNEVKEVLNDNGISDEIIDLAKKMDIDLYKLIDKKIIDCKISEKENNINVVSKNILGVYGNYIAYLYYKGLGYNPVFEYPIRNEDNNVITKADLAFYDKEGRLNLCEVKAAFEIISSEIDYKEIDGGSKNDVIKYLSIGKKLLNQITKLKKYNASINVVVFNNCYLDENLKAVLSNENVSIRTISLDIYELYDQIKQMVASIYDVYHYRSMVKAN